MDSISKHRLQIVGAVAVASLLVVAGVVALNTSDTTQVVALDHAQALASAQNMHLPTWQLPAESEIATPRGWVVDSDQPVEGAEEEEIVNPQEESERSAVSDDDIDSPFVTEEDENGETFVAELGEDVIDDGEDEDEEGARTDGALVGEDAKKNRLRCKYRLKKCSSKKICKKFCARRCKQVTARICKNKKFCRCFCKYKNNVKRAVRCVAYKRKVCRQGKKYLCKRRCRKFCKRVPHCYCCKTKHIVRRCRKSCRPILSGTPCGRCRCRRISCRRTCIMLCRPR